MSEPENVQAFNAALAAFQAKVPHIGKGQRATVKSDKGNYSYDYADLTDITDVVLPLLADQGLAFTVRPTLRDGVFVLDYALTHSSGHSEGGMYPLPDPARSSPQQIGSAITYGRRDGLCAVTGTAPGGDDDDGQHATEARSQPQQAPVVRVADLRAQIAQVAKAKGIDLGAVAQEFAELHGHPIAEGTVESLTAYLRLIRDGEVA